MEGKKINLTSQLEKGFQRYQQDFGITIEWLRGKKVLDLACGTDVEFLEYCVLHGIDITGMDINPPSDLENKKIKNHFVQGDIYHLPFSRQKFDLIVERAIPGEVTLEDLKEMLQLLKDGGEIKLAPFFLKTNVAHAKFLDQVMDLQDSLNFTATITQVPSLGINRGRISRGSLTIKKNLTLNATKN